MSSIGKNIKKIRSFKKLSQTQFGALFNLNRGAVGAYEEERAEPKIDTIIQIANHFSISVDLLLVRELTVNDLYSFNIVNKKLDAAHHFKMDQPAPRIGGGISLVSIDIVLEYLVNFDNKDFISNLPKIDLPIEGKGECRAFEMEGSEMEYYQNGIHHGDMLLTKRIVNEVTNVDLGAVYTFVTSSCIKTRRLRLIEGSNFEFVSDDPNYKAMIVESDEIKQLWKVIGIYSTYLNPPTRIEERVLLMEEQIKLLNSKIK